MLNEELFLAYAKEVTPTINTELERHVSFLPQTCPDILRESIRYSLLSPGKRVRPLLVLLSAKLCDGTQEGALAAACAVEMIHAYSLIHDDLPAMDDDDLRRGKPTNHTVFGEGQAILAGDALLTLAFETLTTIASPTVAVECVKILSERAGYSGMVGGQSDDVMMETQEGDLQMLQSIHKRKTGALIQASILLGATCASADALTKKTLGEFGAQLGLLFQLSDDLLDATGDEAKTGKAVKKDEGKGKLTYPTLLGVEETQKRLDQLFTETIQTLESFGEKADTLKSLAWFVAHRTH